MRIASRPGRPSTLRRPHRHLPTWWRPSSSTRPATRVDEAAFAAKVLADHLLARLEELGLACDRVVVEAETEHGERHVRCWRHEGGLTAAALVTRVRWQLDAWLTGRDDEETEDATGGLTLLRIAPDRVVPATGRQLGFWGGDAAAHDRAARVLARLQGMLGPRGGRDRGGRWRTGAERARPLGAVGRTA